LSPAPSLAQQGAAPPPAPAAAQPLPSWLEYKPAYVGEENDISNPHRTTEEITTWAQQAAADVLTFDKDNYTAKMVSFKKYFAPMGWDQYTEYLKDTKVVDMVGGNGYSIGAIVDEVPQIVNQGTTNGAYHWILRMPLTISFFTKDAASGQAKTGPSGKFYLFVDILRVAKNSGIGGEDGIAIISWRVMSPPKP
jgi:hypothetical protein